MAYARTEGEPQVSSALICDQLKLMRGLYGEDVVTRAEARLPDALRDELSALTPSGHCSLDLARELKTGVADLVGMDPIAFQRDICKRGLERTLTTIWRFFVRQLGDEALSKRIPLLYSRSFNRGALALTAWRPGGAELELRGWPNMPEYDAQGLMAAGEKLFELAGRVDVRISIVRRPPLILVHAHWRR
jgi:hypothetical protein